MKNRSSKSNSNRDSNNNNNNNNKHVDDATSPGHHGNPVHHHSNGHHVAPSNNMPANGMGDRALINQRLQALMNMCCLRMRGLPFSAGEKDILNFLSQHAEFVLGSVHMIFNLQGRPSGEAFVQMQNPDAAHKCANDLHLKHMGERYIEVFQCSVQDMTWMLATNHANQLAAQHINNLTNASNCKSNVNNNNNNSNNIICNNNNKSNKYNHHNHRYPTQPSPPKIIPTTQGPIVNGLLATGPPPPPPPPITTNGFLPPNLPAIPVFTSQYPPVMSPVPGCFLQPPQLQPADPRFTIGPGMPPPIIQPMMGQFFNPEPVHMWRLI